MASERRQARRDHTRSGLPVFTGSELPPDLALGPCLEVWADRGDATAPERWHRARRNWCAAVDEWATVTGWAREGRPAVNARNLARTRYVWSRVFLIARGERALVDYLEGRRKTRPARVDEGRGPLH